MNGTVMNAFWNGFASLITAFFEKAKRQGFSIMLLVVVTCVLLWRSLSVEAACDRKIIALQAQQSSDRVIWAQALNAARSDFLECDLRRQEMAIKVAELTVRLSQLEKKR